MRSGLIATARTRFDVIDGVVEATLVLTAAGIVIPVPLNCPAPVLVQRMIQALHVLLFIVAAVEIVRRYGL